MIDDEKQNLMKQKFLELNKPYIHKTSMCINDINKIFVSKFENISKDKMFKGDEEKRFLAIMVATDFSMMLAFLLKTYNNDNKMLIIKNVLEILAEEDKTIIVENINLDAQDIIKKIKSEEKFDNSYIG